MSNGLGIHYQHVIGVLACLFLCFQHSIAQATADENKALIRKIDKDVGDLGATLYGTEKNIKAVEGSLKDIEEMLSSRLPEIEEKDAAPPLPGTSSKTKSGGVVSIILACILIAGLATSSVLLWLSLRKIQSSLGNSTHQGSIRNTVDGTQQKLLSCTKSIGELDSTIRGGMDGISETLASLDITTVSTETANTVHHLQLFCGQLETLSENLKKTLEELGRLNSDMGSIVQGAGEISSREAIVDEREGGLRKIDEAVTGLQAEALDIGKKITLLESQKADNETLHNEAQTLKQESDVAMAEIVRLENFLWPGFLAEEAALHDWRELIRQGLKQKLPGCVSLTGLLYQLSGILQEKKPNIQRSAANVHEIGKQLHKFWEASEVDEDCLYEYSLEWKNAIIQSLQEAGIPLEIKVISCRDNYDMDTMETVQEMTGSRLTVARPTSWIIFMQQENQNRLLHRGEVVTS